MRSGVPGLDKPTSRMLFRKVGKGLDVQTAIIADLIRKNDELEAQLQSIRSRKRKLVIPDPNKDFVDLQAILQSKGIEIATEEQGSVETTAELNEETTDSSSESDEEVQDCITVIVPR
ncbi:hypothetical protein RRF57_009152 [Xylaria bambusicola]|uniref:Uncharacterized protein n=1 Tax=Xylaria bambusicola TaxID=326684 RepID=A0AAN7UUH3_9PEZI